MNLENITLHVEEDKIIETKYIEFVVDFFNGKPQIMGKYANHSKDHLATCKGLSEAKRFIDECNALVKQAQAKGLTTWDFVERYHPKYSSCEHVALISDLELIDEARNIADLNHTQREILQNECEGNMYNCKDRILIEKAIVYEKAIQGFINEHPLLLKP